MHVAIGECRCAGLLYIADVLKIICQRRVSHHSITDSIARSDGDLAG